MWSGIWPPSQPAIETPERALAPFWPRPAVLPRPEPMPRPTRTRDWRGAFFLRRSVGLFLSKNFFLFLSRFSLFRFSRSFPPPPPGGGGGGGGGKWRRGPAPTSV